MMSRRLVACALLLALPVAGCGFWDKGADARAAAEDIAAALDEGAIEKVPFTEPDAATEYRALLEPLAGFPTDVAVDQVTRSGDTAEVTLAWSVDLGGHTWKHTSTAVLEEVDDAWRLQWKPSVVADSLAEGERIRVTRVKAERGDVLGAGETPLVTARPVVRFGIDRTRVAAEAAPESARRLAELLDVTPAPYVKQVRDAGPKAFVQALVVRREAVTQRMLGGIDAIPGARGISDHLPLAPSREFAAALLGTVGPATAEIIEESEGRLRAGDDAGLSGLQRRYDETLAGTPGVKVAADPAVPADDAAGSDESGESDEPRTLFEAEPVDGADVALTLEPVLQQRADDLLAKVGPASGLVAIRPSTGEILAAASGPGSEGYNTATFGQYAPGSTFKVVSALALLRSGLTPDSPVDCPPSTTVDGKRFENYDDYPANRRGRITLRDAVAQSCNTAFVSQHARLAGNALAEAAAALGVGVDHDLGFPAYFGQVPAPAGEVEAAADLIGQGKVLASPMAMAVVAASVVEGATVVPHLVTDAGEQTPASPTAAGPAVPLTSAEAGQLRTLMRAVVTEGSGRALRSLTPPAVLAKTGTAEYGTEAPLPTHAWMIGAQGDLAVAVFVATGESGSRVAGPILEAFLRAAGQGQPG